MSGHSKWANIKHRKGRQDAIKGKVFTKLGKELIVAAKMGGANPEANFRLKIAIQKAKAANMPNDNIERAIQKGAGGQDDKNYEELVYEGYGPAGVAVMVNILTDNRNRTAGEIRHIFTKNGGSLGETGCVGWMFKKKGIIVIRKEDLEMDEDDLMLLALEEGAEDIETSDEEELRVVTAPEDFQKVKEGLEGKGVVLSSADVTMVPDTTVEVTDQEQAKKILNLMDILEDHEDVQDSYTNFDIPDEVMEQL